MNKEEIKNYIQEYKDSYSKAQITTELTKKGVSEAEINEIYSTFNDSTAKPNEQKTYVYGGFWARFLALILDSIIVGTPLSLIFDIAFPIYLNIAVPYLGSILFIIYIVYLEGTSGSTLGKQIMGLRVVDARTGGSIGIPKAILRYVGKIISGMLLLAGYIMAAFDKKTQALHDKIASTYVIKKWIMIYYLKNHSI